MPLLTSNKELKPHRIWNWSIPAWYTRLPDGTFFKTCPNAGICAKLCYARNGTYLFRNVKSAHDRNLQFVLSNPDGWQNEINTELASPKFHRYQPRQLPEPITQNDLDPWMQQWVESGKAAIRIHDAGDFFARWYLVRWTQIAENNPTLLFYAYTKEVALFKEFGELPTNFRYLFSTGGLQDQLIETNDRRANVFPNQYVMEQQGYLSQDANDLLAIMLPSPYIGITANNIRHFNKRMGGKTFSELQNQ